MRGRLPQRGEAGEREEEAHPGRGVDGDPPPRGARDPEHDRRDDEAGERAGEHAAQAGPAERARRPIDGERESRHQHEHRDAGERLREVVQRAVRAGLIGEELVDGGEREPDAVDQRQHAGVPRHAVLRVGEHEVRGRGPEEGLGQHVQPEEDARPVEVHCREAERRARPAERRQAAVELALGRALARRRGEQQVGERREGVRAEDRQVLPVPEDAGGERARLDPIGACEEIRGGLAGGVRCGAAVAVVGRRDRHAVDREQDVLIEGPPLGDAAPPGERGRGDHAIRHHEEAREARAPPVERVDQRERADRQQDRRRAAGQEAVSPAVRGWGHRLVATSSSRASLAPEGLVVVHAGGAAHGHVLADERAVEVRAALDQEARGRGVDHAVEARPAAGEADRLRARHVDREVLGIRVGRHDLRLPGDRERVGDVERDRASRVVDVEDRRVAQGEAGHAEAARPVDRHCLTGERDRSEIRQARRHLELHERGRRGEERLLPGDLRAVVVGEARGRRVAVDGGAVGEREGPVAEDVSVRAEGAGARGVAVRAGRLPDAHRRGPHQPLIEERVGVDDEVEGGRCARRRRRAVHAPHEGEDQVVVVDVAAAVEVPVPVVRIDRVRLPLHVLEEVRRELVARVVERVAVRVGVRGREDEHARHRLGGVGSALHEELHEEALDVAEDDVLGAEAERVARRPRLEHHRQVDRRRVEGDVGDAVAADGVAYIAFDATAINLPMVFEARAAGYPLRFGAEDVVFRNIQGFLMQLLMQGAPDATQPVPGMFVFPAANPDTDGDTLHYSRHEFTTYFLQHMERQPHAVDPNDGNWHLDGSRHVDHNHLILALMGSVNGAPPAPGATPPFDLVVSTYSLFYQGLAGTSSVSIGQSARTDSYDPSTGTLGAHGDVFSNGPLTLSNSAMIKGDATATSFTFFNSSKITGQQTLLAAPTSFMQLKVPAGLPDLGTIALSGQSMTINGPGSFRASSLSLSGPSVLFIDNSKGPVTLYLTAGLAVSGQAKIVTADTNPEHFAIYVASTNLVSLTSGGPTFYGVVYAPTSSLVIQSSSNFYGAFVGQDVSMTSSARVHYDQALRGQ